jgi:hypothetical protein
MLDYIDEVNFDLIELSIDMHQVCRNNWRLN